MPLSPLRTLPWAASMFAAAAFSGPALALTPGQGKLLLTLGTPGTAGPLEATLVFLNACEAGIEQPGLWAHGGWASTFLREGAGALIAPSWTVSDRGASCFAETFYRHAATGLPLGEAARLSRCEIARRSPVDRIAYAVYAAPQSRLYLQ